ncbi:MAG: hypothetical protein D6743_09020, partial [Calditrichaeota bacterium]
MKKPNIILISIDTLRADHLSCYGHRRLTTPSLDRIAEEGVLFSDAYSTAAWTPPAHASMFTGLYPSQHGVVDEYKLDHGTPTIASILSASGYLTAGFINNSMVGELVGLHRGHQHFDEIWVGAEYSNPVARGLGFLSRKLRQWSGTSDQGAALTNSRVLHWMHSALHGSSPFYLFIHYIDVHNPMNAPRPFRNRFLRPALRRSVDMKKIRQVADNPLVCLTDHLELTADEIEALRCIYDEGIAYVDHRIGEVLDFLRQQGVLDETLLIITADHGEHFGEHGLYSHVSSLYQPVLHIPMIVRYPKAFGRGLRRESLAQHVDLLPTILEATGLSYPGQIDLPGRSLLSSTGPERDLFAEWEGRVPHFVRNRLGSGAQAEDLRLFTTKQAMILSGAHKLIRRDTGEIELYD